MKLRRILTVLAGLVILAVAIGGAYFTGLWIPNHPNAQDYPSKRW